MNGPSAGGNSHDPASLRNSAAVGPVNRRNSRGINNMPFLFYLPFIIASGMFSMATESFAEKPEKEKPKREA